MIDVVQQSTATRSATMTKQLMDRVAIVTGASNGLGRGIAEALAAAGAKTALAARRTQMLEEVASGIREAGGTPMEFNTVAISDVISRDDCERFPSRARYPSVRLRSHAGAQRAARPRRWLTGLSRVRLLP